MFYRLETQTVVQPIDFTVHWFGMTTSQHRNLYLYFEATVRTNASHTDETLILDGKKKIIQPNLLKIVIWFGIQRIVPMVYPTQFNSDSISENVWVLMIVIIQYSIIYTFGRSVARYVCLCVCGCWSLHLEHELLYTLEMGWMYGI